MDLELYSWNLHERNLIGQDQVILPSKSKIRIKDCLELRRELEELLEDLPHKALCLWALENAQNFLRYFDEHLKEDERIFNAEIVLLKRTEEKAGAYELRQEGFIANQLAKESTTEIGKISARVFAQAIATGHMRGHGILSADYAIKVINLLYPGNPEPVIEERRKQIRLANIFSEKYSYK